jgi:Spy/CpxP family protein refolding chaperone
MNGSLKGLAGVKARQRTIEGRLNKWKDWKMKRNSFILALVVLGTLAFVGNDAMARGPRHGRMAGDGPGMGFGLIRMLDRMDLSQDQERQIAAILKSHRDEIAKVTATAAEAGSALEKAMNAPDYGEDSVKEAARTIAAQHERMILLRAKIMSEVRSVLTPDQNERIQRFAAQRSGRFQGGAECRLAAMDRWIAEHGN